MEYTVSREVRTLVTLHEGTDTTARGEASDELAGTLESLAETDTNRIAGWEGIDAEVYEHPAAPFDPYTVAVSFRLLVSVDAESSAQAEERGGDTIDDLLESADLESISYQSPVTASVA